MLRAHFSRLISLGRLWNPLICVFALCLLAGVLTDRSRAEINLPHKYPRSNPNLLDNPTFNGSTSWVLNSGPVYQSTGGRTPDGSGCIKFPAGEDTYCQLISEYFYMDGQGGTLEYNTPYTVSWHMKTQHEPVYLSVCLHMYDAYNNRTFSYSTGRVATSTTGQWQEATVVVHVTDPTIVKVKVVIEEVSSAAYTSDFFIDDAYLGKDISFVESPVAARQAFNGGKVTVDELGNWRVLENGQWKDFFPFGLYPNGGRTNYQVLSDQGFNFLFSLQWRFQLERAKAAVSATYNPNGMRAGLRLGKYAIPNDPYWTLTYLASVIQDLNGGTPDLGETLLCYDWDNENNWTTWSNWFDMVNTVRANDTAHPIYILNGYAGVQRLFSKRLSDVCGTYTGYAGGGMENGLYNFDILQYQQNQDIPASIAQINAVDETSYGMRLRVYYALIQGARGICWWGDGYDNNGNADPNLMVENRAWWSDIPNLRHELDQMLPILKQKHWTDWSASCSDSQIGYNTRTYGNQGYLIVMNSGGSASNATFTLTDYAAREVRDYFTGAVVTGVSGNQFTVTLPGHSTAVYQLYGNILANGGMETAGNPIADWSRYGGGTLTRDTTVKYSGDASAKIVNTLTSQDSQFQQYYAALKPGTQYHFTAMMKTDNVVKQTPSDGASGAVIQLYAGGLNMFFPTGLSGTNDWQQVEKTFTTPATPNATWYVRLRLRNASGTAWYDDVNLQEVLP